MTFTDFGGSLPTGFKLMNLHVFHVTGGQTEDVPFCSAGHTAAISGDCLFSATQPKNGANVTVTIQGPAQGLYGKGG
jgi:hypothetical protein